MDLLTSSLIFGSLNCSLYLSVALRVERAALDLGKTPFVCKF